MIPRLKNVLVILCSVLASCHAFVSVPSRTSTSCSCSSTSSIASLSRSDSLLETILTNPADESQISTLALQLTQGGSSNTFEPAESLFGPLYCTVAAFTPNNPDATKPLWERISLKPDNLKGQQYTQTGPLTGTVINYSEVWGPAFHLRAEGSFVPQEEEESMAATREEEEVKPGFWESLLGGGDSSSGSSTKKNEPTATTRSCPDDYRVTVNKASFCFGDSFSIDLPIEGSSTLRVLYADPKLRIFVSPQAMEGPVGDWENAGLVVVQVRSDLVTGGGGVEMDLRKE